MADWTETTKEVRTFSVHVTINRQQLVPLSLSMHLTHGRLATPTNDHVSMSDLQIDNKKSCIQTKKLIFLYQQRLCDYNI